MLERWFSKRQRIIVIAYTILQLVIWAKCLVFFYYFGYGKVTDFSVAVFSQQVVFIDFLFHEFMHVAIGVLALLFGASFKKIKWKRLWIMVFAAVAMHNLAYWLTVSHSSIAYSAVDFVSDSVLLMIFVVAGSLLEKILPRLNKRFKFVDRVRCIQWVKKKNY